MNESTTEYYKRRNESTQNKLLSLKRKLTLNATYRLLSFAGILGFLFGLAQFNITTAIVLASISLITFLALVRRQIILLKKKKYNTALTTILGNEIDACNHIFTGFRDGNEFRNPRHCYSHDLDLFGPGSLFQMLNRSVTIGGEKKLSKLISNENISIEEIEQLQAATKELAKLPDLLIHFRATGTISGFVDEDQTKISKWLSSKSFMSKNKFLDIMRYFLPGCLITSIVWLSVFGQGGMIAMFLFVLNLIITGFYYKKSNTEHNQVSKFLTVLIKYQDLLSVFETANFKSKLLVKISDDLKTGTDSAAKALKDLTKTVNALDSRLNFVAAIFLEGLFQWDFHCLAAIEDWRNKYGSRLIPWLENIAQFDSYVSMATFAYNNPSYCYPTPKNDIVISTKGVGHPFIPESVRVLNDYNINNRGEFSIITGANMAGKSTFLRTIGINLILAMSGMPVCADKFSFTPRKLFTSMRTSDSLNENESYFYAELRRLKEMVDKLEEGEDLFIILDEILKGTNSVDKQKGSQLALEKILLLKGTGIIATHDLALTDLEQTHPKEIKNQCFEIEIDNTEINFDYKLYDGVTQKMNAMLLMEQMGII